MDDRQTGSSQLTAPSQLTDEALLLEDRATGDERLFAQLVRRYEQELFRYLRRYLGDAAMAEDAFQGTFLQVHLKCDRFEEGRKFRPWLYKIATNQAIDTQRRNRRHRLVSLDQGNPANSEGDAGKLLDVMESREPGPVKMLESAEREGWVDQAVEDLPDALRSAVSLVYYQGMKYREAADVLSIPVGTVKSRVHSAIVKLNEAWSHAQRPESD